MTWVSSWNVSTWLSWHVDSFFLYLYLTQQSVSFSLDKFRSLTCVSLTQNMNGHTWWWWWCVCFSLTYMWSDAKTFTGSLWQSRAQRFHKAYYEMATEVVLDLLQIKFLFLSAQTLHKPGGFFFFFLFFLIKTCCKINCFKLSTISFWRQIPLVKYQCRIIVVSKTGHVSACKCETWQQMQRTCFNIWSVECRLISWCKKHC